MVTIDIRETLIPFSLLRIANAFTAMRPGDEMEILAGSSPDDAATFKDIMQILPPAEYDLVCREDRSADAPVTRLRLKKKVSATTGRRRR